MTPQPDDEVWGRIRAEFPVTEMRSYLFAGGIAPLSRAARAATDRYLALWEADPMTAYRRHPREEAAQLRAEVAALVGAQPDELAIVDSTSRGSNLAVQMLAAPPGSNVVVDSTTYPTARLPWLLREGVELRDAPDLGGEPSLAELRRLVDERTVAVSVSHVCRVSGFRHDLRELAAVAHAAGAALVVDAAQSAGVVGLDVRADGVDFLSFGAMKWLLGAPGVAFFYVRPALQERLRPPHVGGAARVEEGRLVLPAGAARHEISSFAWTSIGACREGLVLLGAATPAAVEARVRELATRVIDGLRERGIRVRTPDDPARRAGIVAFECARPSALRSFLAERGVDVWGSDEHGVVRADPHVYNTAADVERFLATLDGWLSDN